MKHHLRVLHRLSIGVAEHDKPQTRHWPLVLLGPNESGQSTGKHQRQCNRNIYSHMDAHSHHLIMLKNTTLVVVWKKRKPLVVKTLHYRGFCSGSCDWPGFFVPPDAEYCGPGR